MEYKPTISIIIPVYNVERFLQCCVDSVISQIYKDWELLLVDDGSTDGSGIMCDKYASIDNRIRVFHLKNGGPSSARNKGIIESKGIYITFIDSDDWVSPQYLSDLISANFDNENAWVVSGYRTCYYSNEKLLKTTCCLLNDQQFSFERKAEAFQELDLRGIFFTNVGKLYQSRIIKINNLRFNEKYKLAEDTLFNFDYLQYIDGSIVIKSCVNYNYRQVLRSTSLINKYNPQVLDVGLILLAKRIEWAKKCNDSNYHARISERKINLIISSVLNLYKQDAKLSVGYKIKELEKIKKVSDNFLVRNINKDLKNRFIFSLLHRRQYYVLNAILTCYYFFKND